MAPQSTPPLAVLLLVGLTLGVVLPATAIWPQPETLSATLVDGKQAFVCPKSFMIDASSETLAHSELVRSMVDRYRKTILFPIEWSSRGLSDADCRASPHVAALKLLLTKKLDEVLHSTVDESYTLKISAPAASIDTMSMRQRDAMVMAAMAPSSGSVAELSAPSVWGLMRGIESFSQLIRWEVALESYVIDHLPIEIQDRPALPWRGLLIDTARHFHSMESMLRLVDAMAYNKLNVLHWHLSDAQSFSFESKLQPELNLGQWSSHARYTHADVTRVVEHARKRGIRVVPEIDMPAHSASWTRTIQVRTPACLRTDPLKRPIDPASEHTYQVIEQLVFELTELFPDRYFHIGADEVDPSCWETQDFAEHARKYLATRGVHDTEHISDMASFMMHHFLERVHDIVHSYDRVPVMWEEAFLDVRNNTYTVSSVLQAWRCWGSYASNIKRLSSERPQLPLLWSTCFYLDWLDKDWKYYYLEKGTGTHDFKTLKSSAADSLLGAEMAVWSEHIGDGNLDSATWPRGSAIAELFWTTGAPFSNETAVAQRLDAFHCYLLQRGILAAPIDPSFCYTPSLDREVPHSSADVAMGDQHPPPPSPHQQQQPPIAVVRPQDGGSRGSDLLSFTFFASVSFAALIGYYFGRRARVARQTLG